MSFPTSRKEAIAMIDVAGKRDEFGKGWGYSLEEYFDGYQEREPGLWFNVLTDLDIQYDTPTSVDLLEGLAHAAKAGSMERCTVLAEIGIYFGLDKGSVEIPEDDEIEMSEGFEKALSQLKQKLGDDVDWVYNDQEHADGSYLFYVGGDLAMMGGPLSKEYKVYPDGRVQEINE